MRDVVWQGKTLQPLRLRGDSEDRATPAPVPVPGSHEHTT